LGSFFGGQNVGKNDPEKWGFFNVFDFNLPSDEELKHLKAIIIPGSEASACDHAKVSWMTILAKFIVKIYTEYP
jgi:GMP synthase-like glutamine amidotransferase